MQTSLKFAPAKKHVLQKPLNRMNIFATLKHDELAKYIFRLISSTPLFKSVVDEMLPYLSAETITHLLSLPSIIHIFFCGFHARVYGVPRL